MYVKLHRESQLELWVHLSIDIGCTVLGVDVNVKIPYNITSGLESTTDRQYIGRIKSSMYLKKKKQDNNGFFDISAGLESKINQMLDVENSLHIYFES